MRGLIAGALLLALVLLGVAWAAGGDRVLMAWALEGQRTAQESMAGALRALRAGEPGALAALCGVCFLYGVFHAAGPGHGKLLIGGYGAAQRVGALRLSAVALVASLAQGLTAIALVGAGVWLVGWSRSAMTGLAERWLTPLSFAAIAAIGLWLALRGARALAQRRAAMPAGDPAHPAPDHAPHAHAPHAHAPHDQAPHDHAPHHHDHGPGCGHAHGPDPEAVAAARSLRDLAALVGAIAIRPCTGALFVLVLTAQFGIFAAGVLATLAMALGTASVTVAVALAAVGLRAGLVGGLGGGAARLARVQPWIELALGLAIAAIALRLAAAAL